VSQFEFDENVAKQMEVLYSSGDFLRRRALVLEALAAKPGERILDVGCGPGFYLDEILEYVGSAGPVVGIDPSAEMLAVAAKRVEGRGAAELHEADAISLPLENAYFDGAISVQTLEYVDDATRALSEMYRVLRPGGRVVIWDVDWGTVSWQSSDPERMRRVLNAWDEHLAHPSLPRTLSSRVRSAGFVDVRFDGHVFTTDQRSREAYGGASAVSTIANFVVGRQGISAEEAAAWKADLRELGERGEYFFSCVQFCFTATKPIT
jgi:ubiquinone/menaquinone biosynthesis C-methylase UbiE